MYIYFLPYCYESFIKRVSFQCNNHYIYKIKFVNALFIMFIVYFYDRYRALFNSRTCHSVYKYLYVFHGLKMNIPYDEDNTDLYY